MRGNKIMKISAEKKKQMLEDSFDLLKDNYKDNKVALHDIIEKMAKIDVNTAVSMWKYLIKEYPGVLHTEDDFGWWMMYAIEKSVGEGKTARIVSEDDFLKKSVYGECGDLQSSPLSVIGLLISQNKLSIASELMNLIFLNKNKCNSLYDILDGVIPDSDEQITEEAFELLSEWIKMVPGKTERAKLNLRMLDFMDEDDEDEDE